MLLLAVGVFWIVAAVVFIVSLCLAARRSVPSCQPGKEDFRQSHQEEPRARVVAKLTLSPTAAFRRRQVLS